MNIKKRTINGYLHMRNAIVMFLTSGGWCEDVHSSSTAEDVLPLAAEEIQPPKTMMVHFNTAINESILILSITIWYAASSGQGQGPNAVHHSVCREGDRVQGPIPPGP